MAKFSYFEHDGKTYRFGADGLTELFPVVQLPVKTNPNIKVGYIDSAKLAAAVGGPFDLESAIVSGNRVEHTVTGKLGVVEKVGATTYNIRWDDKTWNITPHENVVRIDIPAWHPRRIVPVCNHKLYLHKLMTGDIIERCLRSCGYSAKYCKVSEKY